MKPAEIAECAKRACLLEAGAYPKPGNVGPRHDFSDLTYCDFKKAAEVIVPAVRGAAEGKQIGASILRAMEDMSEVCRSNANLGIVLLLVPLAKGAMVSENPEEVAENATEEVARSSIEGAVDFVRAVRVAKPFLLYNKLDARLEKTEEEVRKKKMSFAGLMKVSAKKDMVAEELLNGFEKSLFAYRTLIREQKKVNVNDAICQTYLELLAKNVDTLVARKFGKKKAEWVKRRAKKALSLGGMKTRVGREEILKFDSELRTERINPGSSADILCAGIFVSLLFD